MVAATAAFPFHEAEAIAEGRGEDVKDACMRTIQNNGHPAHVEATLVTMMADPDEAIRRKAMTEIIRLQEVYEKSDKTKIRTYEAPDIEVIWGAKTYVDFLDSVPLDSRTVPPLFIGISVEVLEEAVSNPDADILGLRDIPAHTEVHFDSIMGNTQFIRVSVVGGQGWRG